MKESVSDRMIALRNLAILTDANKKAQETADLRRQEDAYVDARDKLGKAFENPATTAEEKAFYARLRDQEAAALPLMAEAEKLGLANKVEETNDLLMHRAAPLETAWLGTMKALARLETRQNEDATREAGDAYAAAVRLMLGLAAMALAAGAGAARAQPAGRVQARAFTHPAVRN